VCHKRAVNKKFRAHLQDIRASYDQRELTYMTSVKRLQEYKDTAEEPLLHTLTWYHEKAKNDTVRPFKNETTILRLRSYFFLMLS
jgi:hypothetical protein